MAMAMVPPPPLPSPPRWTALLVLQTLGQIAMARGGCRVPRAALPLLAGIAGGTMRTIPAGPRRGRPPVPAPHHQLLGRLRPAVVALMAVRCRGRLLRHPPPHRAGR